MTGKPKCIIIELLLYYYILMHSHVHFMVKKQEKEIAITLRKEGKTYSEIQKLLPVSKSTLSMWLRDYPLSRERMRAVRDKSQKRIESFRNTMRQKREAVLKKARRHVSRDIGMLTRRELYIAGFFLYWGEGTKVYNTQTSLANTDPFVTEFFLRWLEVLGVPRSKVRARLHLYKDMDEKREIAFWSKKLRLKSSQFRKSYIKDTKHKNIHYQKGGFGHGTCNIIYGERKLNDYILEGIQYLSTIVAGK